MDPHSPNKLFATKYCFLILGDDTSFFFFISLFFVFLFWLFHFVINFYKNYFIIIILFFHENYFYFFLFRNVPCSGNIDAHCKLHLFMSYLLKPNFDLMYCNRRGLTEISKIQLVVYYQCCVLIGWATTRLFKSLFFVFFFFLSQKERNSKSHKLLFWILQVITVLMFSQLTTAAGAQRLNSLKVFHFVNH